MELTGKQYRRIAGLLPVQRGNVTIENRVLLNALIYRRENGCTWRTLPERFGDWHAVYVRLDRRPQNGAPERAYAALTAEGPAGGQVYPLDSTAVKARPDARGGKKTVRRAVGKARGGWNTKIHAPAAGERRVRAFSLSAGNAAGAWAGRLLPETVGPPERAVPLLTDRAYEDDRTRLTARQLRFNPVVPPKRNRVRPRDYGTELYKRRNEAERLFRRLKGFRCVFTRYEKLYRMFAAFVFLLYLYRFA
jgi:transposase